VHVHIPEGAIPKMALGGDHARDDAGVGAGARPVRKDVAMTARSRCAQVLPIGGVKERCSARTRGLEDHHPAARQREGPGRHPKNVLDTLDIYMVDTMDEVLKIALAEPLPALASVAAAPAEVQPAISDERITH